MQKMMAVRKHPYSCLGENDVFGYYFFYYYLKKRFRENVLFLIFCTGNNGILKLLTII